MEFFSLHNKWEGVLIKVQSGNFKLNGNKKRTLRLKKKQILKKEDILKARENNLSNKFVLMNCRTSIGRESEETNLRATKDRVLWRAIIPHFLKNMA